MAREDVRRWNDEIRYIADSLDDMAESRLARLKASADDEPEKKDDTRSCFNCRFSSVRYNGGTLPPDVTCRLTDESMHAGIFNCQHFVRRK